MRAGGSGIAAFFTATGGGTQVVRIGAGCLVGANAGVGISLGDGCVVGDLATVRERVNVGEGVVIGRGVCIENDVAIGAFTKIQTNAYITAGTTLEEHVFIAPGVTTTNDNLMGRTERRHAKLAQANVFAQRVPGPQQLHEMGPGDLPAAQGAQVGGGLLAVDHPASGFAKPRDQRHQRRDAKSRAGEIGIEPAERLDEAGLQPDLLFRLAQRGLQRRLAGIDLAAGKLPQPRHRLARRTLCDQHPAVDVDQGHGSDQHQRPVAQGRRAARALLVEGWAQER